jgi:hypothetical protein
MNEQLRMVDLSARPISDFRASLTGARTLVARQNNAKICAATPATLQDASFGLVTFLSHDDARYGDCIGVGIDCMAGKR